VAHELGQICRREFFSDFISKDVPACVSAVLDLDRKLVV
jgi:hypothetical protein